MMRAKTIGMSLILLLAAGSLWSQNLLLETPEYRRAEELRQMADEAQKTGNYDKVIEYSTESKRLAEEALANADRLFLRYKANGLIKVTADRINIVRSRGLEAKFAEPFGEATAAHALAKDTFGREIYPESIEASQKSLAALARMTGDEPPAKTLPKYYTVRMIPDARDCFWNIAGYPFVYGDPWQWKKLYEANKGKLQNPDNPNLIQPGQVFVIPSLKGEVREGTYKSGK